jgi:hypothetical protein
LTITPEQAAIALLRLGSLSRWDFLTYTGWTIEKAQQVLERLFEQGIVTVTYGVNRHDERYWLTELLPPWEQGSMRAPSVNVNKARQRVRRKYR